MHPHHNTIPPCQFHPAQGHSTLLYSGQLWMDQRPRPASEATALLSNTEKPSLYLSLNGIGRLIPDRKWGPLPRMELGKPIFMSESQLFSFHISKQPQLCTQNYSFDPDVIVNLHQTPIEGDYNCFVIANMTYKVGVAIHMSKLQNYFSDHCPSPGSP